MHVEKNLTKFAKGVIKQSRTNLTKKGRNDRKDLYNTLDYELKVYKNSFHLSFEMEDYGKFVDKGVKGKFKSAKAPSSPYKFGSGKGKKGGLTNSIEGWVKRKRFQFRSKSGKFMSYKSTAFLITRSIYNTGLKTTDFFTRPFELAFKKLPDDLIESYGLDLEDQLQKAFQ